MKEHNLFPWIEKKENNADVQIRNAKKTFKPDLMQFFTDDEIMKFRFESAGI